ncbi:MAG: hypothetical protein KZQ78_10110 [Candidatus Thiodiazotropha sp. (ex Ustalcina ferruginea)]|nr:hypothetical protein [Candidatus Thiodiazotropha sp. (ex Ustalcina ferruginea)]
MAEVAFVALLKQTQWFSNPISTAVFLGCAILSFELLRKAAATIPVYISLPHQSWYGSGRDSSGGNTVSS